MIWVDSFGRDADAGVDGSTIPGGYDRGLISICYRDLALGLRDPSDGSLERGMQCAANGMCGWPWQWPCVVDARSRKSDEARCNKRERQLSGRPVPR